MYEETRKLYTLETARKMTTAELRAASKDLTKICDALRFTSNPAKLEKFCEAERRLLIINYVVGSRK